MEKNLKKIKTITVLLVIVLISVVAFGGVYVKKKGIWNNALKDFDYGMELDGERELHFVLNTNEEEKEIYIDSQGNIAGEVAKEESENANNEENKEQEVSKDIEGYTRETRVIKVNNDEDINIENFEKSKKIIQKRLEKISGYEYNIRLDSITGELIVELPNDNNIEMESYLVTTVGKIEIIDHQTGIRLMDNSNIARAQALTSSATGGGYQAYLQLKLDKEGTEKLKEISKEYTSTTNETGTETIKYITINLDGQEMITTYFGEEVVNGEIQVPMGQPIEDYNTFREAAKSVERIADVINEGAMPLQYNLSSDNYIKSSITENTILVAEIIFAIVILAISVYMIIKYKQKGLKASIVAVGYIAVLTLVIRFVNVKVTINSLIAFISMVAINYVFIIKFVKELNETSIISKEFLKSMKELYLTIIPVCIIAIIFTFMSASIINSVGMVLFWGLLVQALYNSLVILGLGAIQSK